ISINAVIDSTETPDEYRVQVNSPRELLILELGEDGKKLRVYQYNVAWSPDQKPPDSAEFYVGDIQSPQVDFNLFKKQNNITVTKGYRLTSATVYFSGTGFSRVYISKDSVFSNFQNRLIDLCLPGSVITYDMVSAVDPVGKTIMLPGRSYRLTDLNDVKDDYASLVVYPDFEGGDKALRHYVLKALEKFRPNELERGKYKFFFSVIVNTDGSLSDVYDEDPTKSEFEHICYYLIKNSTGWIPGTFRGQKVRMIAPVYLDIEVN
ncbi:MAG TPA: hypothetical protein VKH37_07530, partial [Ferruginibacter sp.]|nr:hypothetical protein [Ferruginibacter sp.]